MRKVFRVTPYRDGQDVIQYGSLVLIDCKTLQQALREASKWEQSRINYCILDAVEGHDMYTDQYNRDRGIWSTGISAPCEWYKM